MALLASRVPTLQLQQQQQQHSEPDMVDMQEFTDLHGAATSFVKLLASQPRRAVRLHCTVPTWSTSSEFCTDLHDLHELRSRSLVFIHDLCKQLNSAGIQVSYRLAPSHTSLVLLRAISEDRVLSREEPTLMEETNLCGREKAFVTSFNGIPSIILT